MNQRVGPPSMVAYAAHLESEGERVFFGEKETLWVSHGSGAMTRIPVFHLSPPNSNEIPRLFRMGRTMVIDYIIEPNERHPANAWLYICTDQSYGLEIFSSSSRTKIRRGLKEFRIAAITSDELLAHGLQAFCNTRRRVGLSDGTPETFKRRFREQVRFPGHVFFGAWKDNQLAAFLSIIEIDNWVEIEGTFSMNAFLKLKVNDALLYRALSYYLTEKRRRVVCYGSSSIQVESNEAGLHAFKKKMGFEAKPVHRGFALHPLLRPFANQLTLWGINTALRFKPGNPMLKKAGGLLAIILGKHKFCEK